MASSGLIRPRVIFGVATALGCFSSFQFYYYVSTFTDWPASLPAVRFADFVAAEQGALRSTVDRDFWTATITSADKLEIPAVRPAEVSKNPCQQSVSAWLPCRRLFDTPLSTVLRRN